MAKFWLVQIDMLGPHLPNRRHPAWDAVSWSPRRRWEAGGRARLIADR
jgi:hypothetical protein